MTSKKDNKFSTERVLVIPDVHLPYEDKKAVDAVFKYAKVFRPDRVILIGDLLDFNCISSHNLGNLRAVETTSLDKDYKVGNEFLDKLHPATNGVDVEYLEGNHEYRVERYVNANPRLEGLVEVERNLSLVQRGIRWVPSWSQGAVVRIGKALFLHGRYHNDHHAKSMVLAYEENVFYGHCHDVQAYPKTALGDNNTKIGQSLGCLCAYNQGYLRGGPNKWQQAFGIFYMRSNGFFNYYTPFIFNGSFVAPDGKVYEGKTK